MSFTSYLFPFWLHTLEVRKLYEVKMTKLTYTWRTSPWLWNSSIFGIGPSRRLDGVRPFLLDDSLFMSLKRQIVITTERFFSGFLFQSSDSSWPGTYLWINSQISVTSSLYCSLFIRTPTLIYRIRIESGFF